MTKDGDIVENNNEHKINLPLRTSKQDWTQTIHQQLNIGRRTCTTFIPKVPLANDQTNKNDLPCACKRLRREHSWDVTESEELVWNRGKHTQAALNNAYGYLPITRANYIRCDIETKPDILAQLLYDVWKIKPPRLLMCIIGGAKYFKLNERLEREFIKGIIQAALKADGWIVTSGFKTGVVQLVGEAIHDHKVTNPRSHITAIGCSKWGATRNRDALILKKSSSTTNHSDVTTSKNAKGQQDLEPNHTHFILLDDGTYYGYEMDDYRTRFVHEISRYRGANVPNVTLVVEGGPDTLTTIYNDLHIGIPVVLIDGSGRIPNLLASFLTRTEAMVNRNDKADEDLKNWKEIVDINETEKLRQFFRTYEEEIRNGLKAISKGSKTSDKEMDKLFSYFLYCLQPAVRSQLKIFSLDSDHDLDDTIFEAIIQVKQKKSSETNTGLHREQLLHLALAWDAIEVAKEHIIKDDLSDLSVESKTRLFLEALMLDRPQFVNTFIKLNFNLSEMFYERQINKPWKLKWDQLVRLYNDHEQKKKERLYLFAKCRARGIVDSEHELDRVLRHLIGDYMKPIYTESRVSRFGRLKLCYRCPPTARVADDNHVCLPKTTDEDDWDAPDPEQARKEVRELVYRDLFIWCVLTNRIEMSKVLLSHMGTRICASLIASKVFKSYVNLASDNESKDILSTQADQFEDYANECLKCCYNFDEEKACEIAIRRINIFGGVTCIQVAVDADDKNFLGQPCCDQLLNNIWYDQMEPIQSSITKRIGLLLSIGTFGLLAPFLVTFRQAHCLPNNDYDQQKDNNGMILNEGDESKKEKLQSVKPQRLNHTGINYSDSYVWPSTPCMKPYVNYVRHLKQFHEASIVKYSYNAGSFIVFLLLFSYYLLFNFQIPTDEIPSIHWSEILVIIMVTSMLIEEIRNFLSQDNRSMAGKFSNYFISNQFGSVLRVTSYLLFYIGLVLRFTQTETNDMFSSAKIVLAYDLEIWFMRSLSFLAIAQKMGPKLVMIRKMVIDLFFFTYIILTAMIGYGVASRTMYDYNNTTIDFNGRSIFRNIMYPVYYLMYGNMDNELQALDANQDSSVAIATHILLAFHMLFVNILLINLLIAMFSFTFEAVQTHTDLVWRYERYSLIREYFDRPPLFPPLSILIHLVDLIGYLFGHLLKRTKGIERKTFKMIGASREVDKDWSEFESYATNVYARLLLTKQPLSASSLVPSKSRQEQQQQQQQQQPSDAGANNLQFQSGTGYSDTKTIADELSSVRKAVSDLRTHSEEINRCMHWMMEAMDRVKMSKDPKPKLKSAITTDDIKAKTDD